MRCSRPSPTISRLRQNKNLRTAEGPGSPPGVGWFDQYQRTMLNGACQLIFRVSLAIADCHPKRSWVAVGQCPQAVARSQLPSSRCGYRNLVKNDNRRMMSRRLLARWHEGGCPATTGRAMTKSSCVRYISLAAQLPPDRPPSLRIFRRGGPSKSPCRRSSPLRVRSNVPPVEGYALSDQSPPFRNRHRAVLFIQWLSRIAVTKKP